MSRMLFPLLLLLASCAGNPFSGDGEVPRDFQEFLKADADGSGKLNPAEAAAFPGLARNFARYDADADGLVAWNELRRVGGIEGDRRRYGSR